MLREAYVHGVFIRQKAVQSADVHVIILILFLYFLNVFILNKIYSGVGGI